MAGKLCSSPAGSDPTEELPPGKTFQPGRFPGGKPSPALAVLGFGVQITSRSSRRRDQYLPENCTMGSEEEGINNLLPPCWAFWCLCLRVSSCVCASSHCAGTVLPLPAFLRAQTLCPWTPQGSKQQLPGLCPPGRDAEGWKSSGTGFHHVSHRLGCRVSGSHPCSTPEHRVFLPPGAAQGSAGGSSSGHCRARGWEKLTEAHRSSHRSRLSVDAQEFSHAKLRSRGGFTGQGETSLPSPARVSQQFLGI